MNSIDVDTHEVTAFVRLLNSASAGVTDEMRDATERATGMLMNEARQMVRVRTGETRRMIGRTVRVVSGSAVGEVRSAAPWSRYLEHGRGPIEAAPGRVLRWVSPTGAVIYARRVGPAAAQPFMAPALAATRIRIRAEYQGAVRKAMLKALGA